MPRKPVRTTHQKMDAACGIVLPSRHVTSTNRCRPAVVISYLIASFAALLSAFTYAEFAVDLRVAGGAYVYANLVFGELTGWCASLHAASEAQVFRFNSKMSPWSFVCIHHQTWIRF